MRLDCVSEANHDFNRLLDEPVASEEDFIQKNDFLYLHCLGGLLAVANYKGKYLLLQLRRRYAATQKPILRRGRTHRDTAARVHAKLGRL